LNRIGRRTIMRMLLIAALARGMAGDNGSPDPGRDVRRADDIRSDRYYAGDQPPQSLSSSIRSAKTRENAN